MKINRTFLDQMVTQRYLAARTVGDAKRYSLADASFFFSAGELQVGVLWPSVLFRGGSTYPRAKCLFEKGFRGSDTEKFVTVQDKESDFEISKDLKVNTFKHKLTKKRKKEGTKQIGVVWPWKLRP